MEVSKERMIELVKNAPDGEIKATHTRRGVIGYYYIVIGTQVASISKDGTIEVLNERLDYYEEFLVKLDHSVLEDKPVYTQEMCDAGVLPPVGSDCIFSYADWKLHNGLKVGDRVSVLAHTDNNGVNVAVFSHKDVHGIYVEIGGPTCFKPIDTRTDQEKLIDDLAEKIFNCVHPTLDFDKSIGESWVDAATVAINITRKGESND